MKNKLIQAHVTLLIFFLCLLKFTSAQEIKYSPAVEKKINEVENTR